MSRRFQILLAAAALASPTGTRLHNLSRSDSVMRRLSKIFLDPDRCAPAKKAARSAKRQDQQAGTEQEKAGDGHRKEGIGGKFVTHCSHSMRAPLSLRRSLRSWICGFSHPCA